MPSGIKKPERSAPLAGAGIVAPLTAPDTALSPAFRNVLGSSAPRPHLPASALTGGQEMAKQAKTKKLAGSLKSGPRGTPVRPRSGHK